MSSRIYVAVGICDKTGRHLEKETVALEESVDASELSEDDKKFLLGNWEGNNTPATIAWLIKYSKTLPQDQVIYVCGEGEASWREYYDHGKVSMVEALISWPTPTEAVYTEDLIEFFYGGHLDGIPEKDRSLLTNL